MSYLVSFSSLIKLIKTGIFLGFHHVKIVRFLENIWSRRIHELEACIWVLQKDFASGMGCPCFPCTLSHTRTLVPTPQVLILASEGQGNEQAGGSQDPRIPYCKSVKERRKNFYEESRTPDNAADLLSKCCSRARDTVSVFDWYEANLCPKVSAITKVRVEFVRVACSTESNILVLVCDRIILDVLGKNPTSLKKNPEKKRNRKYFFYILTFHKALSLRQNVKYQLSKLYQYCDWGFHLLFLFLSFSIRLK